MKFLPELFEKNREWADAMVRRDPEFFRRLCGIQRPDLLWLGCSDSRVPANEIVGRAPGELFVHRNVANVVPASDLNAMAVVEFAVGTLGVRHVIVCGHAGCGGVKAVLQGLDASGGAVTTWLRHVEAVARDHAEELSGLGFDARWLRLCELNVKAQVRSLARCAPVEAAWARGAPLVLHGWIYDLKDGLLRDLDVSVGTLAPGGATVSGAAGAR